MTKNITHKVTIIITIKRTSTFYLHGPKDYLSKMKYESVTVVLKH